MIERLEYAEILDTCVFQSNPLAPHRNRRTCKSRTAGTTRITSHPLPLEEGLYIAASLKAGVPLEELRHRGEYKWVRSSQ